MNTSVINIKVDPKTKQEAQAAAKELGLSLSAAVKTLLKQFVRTRRLSVDLDEKPSKYLINAMKQAEKNRKSGNHSPVFKTGEEAVKWLEEQGI